MPLPASGQISFNDVRTETSQSSLTNYDFAKWVAGINTNSVTPWQSPSYAPINVLSSGSRFSSSSLLNASSNMSMSKWYGYNHTASLSASVTASFYLHVNPTTACYGSSMIPVDLGTSNTTWSLNISGSDSNVSRIEIYYGKPWKSDGSSGTSSLSTLITSSIGSSINGSITYNYTYDSTKGRYVYFILIGTCP